MANPRTRDSVDGSESNFSLIDHGFANESALSEGGYGDVEEDGSSARASRPTAAVRAYYPISTIMSNPRAASAAQTITTNLSNLNPLRPTTGPKTGATRGRAAAPIVLSELPKVSAKSFETYIDSIKDEFTAWSRIQSALADAPILDELEDDDALLDEEASKRRKAIKRALETSNISSKSNKKLELPPLETIPPIFFEENFNLANPRTFDMVTAGQGVDSKAIEGSTSSRRSSSDFATDQILQEKLSHWLDVVELHLNVEISLRSASFFSALSNLKELDTQSAEAVKQISEIKEILEAVDTKIARKGLSAVRQGIRRRRLTTLDVAVDRIKEILRAVDQAEELGEAGETDGALDLADEIQREWEASLLSAYLQVPPTPAVEQTEENAMRIIAEEDESEQIPYKQDVKVPATPLTALRPRADHHRPVRIAQIKCLSSVPSRLDTLRSTIAQTLEQEFVAVLLHATREGRDILTASTEQWRANPGVQAPIFEDLRESTASRVRASLHGLVRCGKAALDSAIVAWREALLKEVRRTLRDLLPSSSHHDDDETPADNTPSSRSSVEENRTSMDGLPPSSVAVHQLDQLHYMELMRGIHTSMLSLLLLSDIQSRAISVTFESIVQSTDKIVGDKNSDAQVSSGTALNDAWGNTLRADLTDTVQAVAELINARLARIVASRGEVHSRLSLLEFYTAFSESWQFVLDCEVICRKMIVGLRGVIVGQAKSFLQQFHQQNFLEVAQAVQQEQWSPADVPVSSQAAVDRILQSAVETPASWELKNYKQDSTVEAKQTAKQLTIEDRSFFAVTATLRCVEALEKYLQVVTNLPLLGTDVMSRIIEFLKQYNSRVCQMVLGAGAMRSAGLKNITAKHLAMASQSISILISIIPYTRECLRRHLRAKQAVILVDFDKLKRDCQEHQNEIHAKLVAIMGDRLSVHCQTLQEIKWEQPAASNGKPNPYMETLVKETGTLHKVLLKYLAGSALEVVMMQVLSAINSRLAEEFSRITLKSDVAKGRMLIDAEFLKEKFAELKGLERAPPGAELVHLVQDKMVERPAPAPTAPGLPKSKSFSTPSMTQSRKLFDGHNRTPSTVSTTGPEETTVETVKPAVDAEPVLSPSPAIREENIPEPSILQSNTVEHVDHVGMVTQAQAEDTPLPMSPEREAPPSLLETLATVQDSSQAEDQAPSTPSKDVRPVSPPVPAKVQEQQPHGAPIVNVKNRLASLFAKRPSIPSIDIPILHTAKTLLPAAIAAAPAGAAPVAAVPEDLAAPTTALAAPSIDEKDDRPQSDLTEDVHAAAQSHQASRDLHNDLQPGEVLPNSSEGSSEDLTIQTSAISLPPPGTESTEQLEGKVVDHNVPMSQAGKESAETISEVATTEPESGTKIDEPLQMNPSSFQDSLPESQVEGDIADTTAQVAIQEAGSLPEIAEASNVDTGLSQGSSDLEAEEPQASGTAHSEEDPNNADPTIEPEQADTSGSTESTFESDVHSAGTAEHIEQSDDLDDID